MIRTRDLVWDGCLNVRDLGGHRTEDGRETRFGAVVRADSVRRLSAAGWEALASHGVTRIVDLRLDEERAADPPHDVDVDVVHVSLFGTSDEQTWAEIDALAVAAPDEAAAHRDVYLEFLRRWPENVAAAVGAVADAPTGCVVVHCHSGKDRTGLVSALLLRLVGVGVDDVAADYALSAERLRTRSDPWIDEAEDEAERERRRRQAATPAETMAGVLHELERRHGGVEAYLRSGGLGDADVEALRARLLP